MDMDKEELIKMLDGYMESGGSYFKAADGKILTDISSGKSEGEKRETAPILTDKADFTCPTCADIPNISTKPDNE